MLGSHGTQELYIPTSASSTPLGSNLKDIPPVVNRSAEKSGITGLPSSGINIMASPVIQATKTEQVLGSTFIMGKDMF